MRDDPAQEKSACQESAALSAATDECAERVDARRTTAPRDGSASLLAARSKEGRDADVHATSESRQQPRPGILIRAFREVARIRKATEAGCDGVACGDAPTCRRIQHCICRHQAGRAGREGRLHRVVRVAVRLVRMTGLERQRHRAAYRATTASRSTLRCGSKVVLRRTTARRTACLRWACNCPTRSCQYR